MLYLISIVLHTEASYPNFAMSKGNNPVVKQ